MALNDQIIDEIHTLADKAMRCRADGYDDVATILLNRARAHAVEIREFTKNKDSQ